MARDMTSRLMLLTSLTSFKRFTPAPITQQQRCPVGTVTLSQHANSFRYVKPQSTSLLKILFFQEKVSLGRQTHAERACRRQFRAGQPIMALAVGQGMCLGLGQVWLDSEDLCCFG